MRRLAVTNAPQLMGRIGAGRVLQTDLQPSLSWSAVSGPLINTFLKLLIGPVMVVLWAAAVFAVDR